VKNVERGATLRVGKTTVNIREEKEALATRGERKATA